MTHSAGLSKASVAASHQEVTRRQADGRSGCRIEARLEQGGASARRVLDEALAAAVAEDGNGLATLSVAVRRLRSPVR